MSQTYRIKPVSWERSPVHPDDPPACESWSASTIFGAYALKVVRDEHGGCQWSWCIDEFYDEGSRDCESIKDGKRQAEAFYLERLLPALKEVK